jgi:hypothetical protein
MPPPLRLVLGRRDPTVLLSLLLSAAVRPGHVGEEDHAAQFSSTTHLCPCVRMRWAPLC